MIFLHLHGYLPPTFARSPKQPAASVGLFESGTGCASLAITIASTALPHSKLRNFIDTLKPIAAMFVLQLGYEAVETPNPAAGGQTDSRRAFASELLGLRLLPDSGCFSYWGVR